MAPNLRQPRVRRSVHAFSLIELLVVILLVGVIAAIVLPALAKSRQKAMAAESLANSRAIGAAFKQYANDHDGALVPVNPVGKNAKANWAQELDQYDQANHRPAAAAAAGIGYNRRLSQVRRLDAIAQPARTVAFGDTGQIVNPEERNPDRWREEPSAKPQVARLFEAPASNEWKTSRNRMVNRYLGRANVVFADGSAARMPVSRVGFQFEAGHARALWDSQ